MPMMLVLAVLTAEAAGPADRLPCRTLELLDGAFIGPELHRDRPPPPPEGKLVRDAYGVSNSLESDNFVIRWGSGVAGVEAQAILEAFELSWEVEVAEMQHPQPQGADSHKFNVYVGSTGGGTPDDYDAAGYFTTDPEGWPMIVLSRATVQDVEYGVTTVAHEFYHAVQYATGTYRYEDEGAWFWEATASWIEAEVYAENPGYVSFLFGYALLPHLELNFFDYPDTGALQEYHQYGAFIFPRYLAELVGDWRIVRNAWVEPQVDGNDPLAAMEAEIGDLGVGLEEAFMDFVSRNVTWDYMHGDWYEDSVDIYAEYFPAQDHRILEVFRGEGTSGTFSPSPALAPRRYGANVMALEEPNAGDLHVRFEGEDFGSLGSPAAFGLTLVRVRGGEPHYQPLMLGEIELDTVVRDGGDADALYVVVGAWSDQLRWDEEFNYAISFEIGAAAGGEDTGTQGDDRAGDDTGSSALRLGATRGVRFPAEGCASRSGGPFGGVALLLAGVMAMSRRRETCASAARTGRTPTAVQGRRPARPCRRRIARSSRCGAPAGW